MGRPSHSQHSPSYPDRHWDSQQDICNGERRPADPEDNRLQHTQHSTSIKDDPKTLRIVPLHPLASWLLTSPFEKMKYFQYPISKTIGYSNCVAKDCGAMPCAHAAAATATSLKPIRNVHFPNDIVFQDYVRTGELERIGRFIRTRRVSLETIYHSGESPDPTKPSSEYTRKLYTHACLIRLFQQWQKVRSSLYSNWTSLTDQFEELDSFFF